MTTEESAPEALAAAFTASLEAGDSVAMEKLLAPGSTLWHNTDGKALQRHEMLELGGNLSRVLPTLRYENIRRRTFDGGCVQQHDVHGLSATGRPFIVPACLVILVCKGQIVRIDEYYDSAHDPR